MHEISWMEKFFYFFFLKEIHIWCTTSLNNTLNKQMLCFCHVIYIVHIRALCNSLASNYSNSILKVFVKALNLYRSCGWQQDVFSWLSVNVGLT